jgi:hypothetical protein
MRKAKSNAIYSSDLSDEEWRLIEDRAITKSDKGGLSPKRSKRLLLDAIF